MLKPEEMSYLNIVIHRNCIPAFLYEIPIQRIHIVKFLESENHSTNYFYRDQKEIQKELEQLQDKINQIEEHLIYYFQNLEIDPYTIETPTNPNDLHTINISSIEDAINQVYNQTLKEHEILQSCHKKRSHLNKELKKMTLYTQIFQEMEIFHPSSQIFSSFKQIEHHICYTTPARFLNIKKKIESMNYPVAINSKQIHNQQTMFLLLHHYSIHDEIVDILGLAKEIEDPSQYYDEQGFKINKINADIENINYLIQSVESSIYKARSFKYRYRAYIEILSNCKKYLAISNHFQETYKTELIRVKAFLPSSRVKEVCEKLVKKFPSQIRITSYSMKNKENLKTESEINIDNSKNGPDLQVFGTQSEEYRCFYSNENREKIKVPTSVKTHKIFRPFRLLVDLYGTTNYDEIDPVPFVALTYPIIFGLMFGDVGHGLILILFGLFLAFLNRKSKNSKYKDGGYLLVWLGFFSGIAGFLYGEFFGYSVFEEYFKKEPILGNPLHNVNNVLTLALIIGVIHLSLGWFLAMLNNFHQKQIYLAIISPAQKIFILYGMSYVFLTCQFDFERWFSNGTNPPYLLIIPLIPTIIFLIGKPLGKILGISYLQEEPMREIIGEQMIDLGETYLNLLSNIASYSRILALAMAHTGLMFMVTELANLFKHRFIVISLILIIGNLFVVIMESIVVTIHALRLTFYEFFGKFYLGDGIPYESVNITRKYSKLNFIRKEPVKLQQPKIKFID